MDRSRPDPFSTAPTPPPLPTAAGKVAAAGPPPRSGAASELEHGPDADSGFPSPWVAGAHFSTYEIESRLAAGGMAEVWRARIKGVEGFEKRIVIKTMLTTLQHRPDLVEMFISEASLAARLSHPNIVDVFDFGQLEGRYFIAMEYVPGVTLRFAHKRAVARGERLPVAAALHVMRDVCEALQYFHELEDGHGALGLVHRDLSPDNVILATSGTTKLIDFGAARATSRTPASRVFVGKYRYAAPERVRNEGEDCRSDVYSAGVILYECLTGMRPFDGTDAQVIRAVTTSPACDPRDCDPFMPEEIAAVVMRATAQHPADRFSNARELGAALARCLSELGASSKERDVTAALSTLLQPSAPIVPAPEAAVGAEAVPEIIEASSPMFEDPSSPTSQTDVALCETEMLEASGAIRVPMDVNDTIRMDSPTPSGGVNISLSDPTVSIFDRRSRQRLAAPAHLEDAVRGSGPTAPGRVTGWRTTTRPRGVPAGGQTALERAVDFFDRGLELRAQERYGEALDAWERALGLAPDNQVYQSSVRRLRDQLSTLRAR